MRRRAQVIPLLCCTSLVGPWGAGCGQSADAVATRGRPAPAPVAPAPGAAPEVDAPWHEPVAERPPATESARKVVDTLAEVEAGMTATKYQHQTRVSTEEGIYFWDCSGMVDWVLRRAAPRARRAIRRERALARSYYDVIARSPTERPRRGWRRLTGPEEIAPGDLFAWRKPPMFRRRKNTGHVGFVIGTPQPHPEHVDVWVMRVADATRILHGDDSRPRGGEGGFGTATMAFLFHPTGAPRAYGWYGSRQHPRTFVPAKIAFGRLEP